MNRSADHVSPPASRAQAWKGRFSRGGQARLPSRAIPLAARCFVSSVPFAKTRWSRFWIIHVRKLESDRKDERFSQTLQLNLLGNILRPRTCLQSVH